jgi:hypothetical protein
MESGDLVPYLPEYVNYLAHAALLHYFSVVTTSTEQPGFTFESDAAGPRIFDKCLEDGVTKARLEDANYWIRYTAILKDEIRYGIHPGGKRKVEDSGKSDGKGTQAKKPVLITPSVKPFVLGQRQFVCWAALAEKWKLKLDRTAPKWQKPCLGKPKCKSVHIDFNRLPSKEDFLDNLHYCRTLTSKDISVLNHEVLALY